MRNFPALLLCVLLTLASLSLTSLATTGSRLPVCSDFSHQDATLRVSREAPEHTVIALAHPPIMVADSLVDYENYQMFLLAGESYEYKTGFPVVPHVTRLYRIPNTGSVDLQVTSAEFETLSGVKPLPYQAEDLRFQTPLKKSPAVYGQNAWYPPEPVVIGEPAIFRDFRVVEVTLYPVQVNAVTGEARVYSNLQADVVANDRPGENELLNPRAPSAAFTQLYRDQIANLDETALDVTRSAPGSYLIICKTNSEVQQWADTLATWKRRLGYTVVIDARSSWTTTMMKNAAQQLYNSDPPLEYVCLFGDCQAGSFGVPTTSTYDHYFATLAGSDDYEDIGVGRLPASSGSDYALIMDKITGYERTPWMGTAASPDTAWFHRAFLYASTGHSISSNEITMYWARDQFRNFTGVNNVSIATHANNVSQTVINTNLNAGDAFFLWRGSVVGEMGYECADATGNGYKLPIVLTITCGTGWMDDTQQTDQPCISERWILAGTRGNPRGGVCGIGTATYGTHVQFNNTVAGGLVYNICNLNVEHLGLAMAGAKAQLLIDFPGEQTSALNFVHWNNLMGDPSLSMWTQVPVVMDVTYPATVNVGTRRVRPQVTNHATGAPIADALVVLLKGTECRATAYTDASGFVDVPVTVNTTGTMTLTVSKRNHKPFLADIACVNAAQMVSLSTHTLDDDNAGGTSGNTNAEANPGETIDLNAYLRNFGTSQQATDVSATLTSNNPHITIVNGTRTFNNIAVGDSSLSQLPFRFTVSNAMRDGEDAILTFAVTASGQLTHSSLEIICQAGDGIYISHSVSGGDNDAYLEPGETANLAVTVRNTGGLDLENVTGTLYAQTGFLAVSNASAPFGTIGIGGTTSNSSHTFTLVASSLVTPGFPAPMLLTLTTPGGFVDSVSFVLPLGNRATSDPAGPDAYGYYAYDNTDVTYPSFRPYNYVNITGTGVGTKLTTLTDPGEQQPLAPTYSVALRLPFPFSFYGKSYDTVTVCSNGWAALGDRHLQDQFRNYPIPGQQAPDALIAPFWDDLRTYTGSMNDTLGVWVYSDVANNRYIIQWKATGAFDNYPDNFEILLLDPVHYPTRDGNGIIVFQYARVTDVVGGDNDVDYATVGIEAPGSLVGLQYSFNHILAPGAASLGVGRSIVFTTDYRAEFGAVAGHVTDFANAEPLDSVAISIEGLAVHVLTDANGNFFLPAVLAGTYVLHATRFGYNLATVPSVVVAENDIVDVPISMLHPEIGLSVNQITVTTPPDPAEAAFTINNAGNGTLEYTTIISYAPTTSLDERWSYLAGINVSDSVADPLIQGCEFVGDYWYVSGTGVAGNRVLYRFDLNGHCAGSLPQPPSAGDLGWFDMAWDGNLLYGSGDGNLIGIDLNGVVQDTIHTPLNPARALAYDAVSGHFWAADYLSNIYELSREGQIIHSFPSALQLTGLAWNPSDENGYFLYLFGRDAANNHAIVRRMHPVSGAQQQLVNLDRVSGDCAGGCTITPSWNSTLLVFAGILQNPLGDRLGVWELDFNTTWITVSPAIGTVSAASSRDVELHFNVGDLRVGTYRVNLSFVNNTATGPVVLPVTFTTYLDVPPLQNGLVREYRLYQNYPNPFNAMTTIRYDLQQTGRATLRVYNLLGQEVATLVDGIENAGAHSISFNTGGLASGVYIYTFDANGFHDTRKLVLLR